VAQAASTYLGEQRRRSTRVEQTLPLIIRGVDLLGQPFEERTATQNLSFHGCSYASKHHLPKNTWIAIEVPTGRGQKELLSVRARVTWIQRPRTLRELFRVGVELESGSNVWGVAIPPGDWISSSIEGMEPLTVKPETHADAHVTKKDADVSGATPQDRSLESYLEELLADAANQTASYGGTPRMGEINIEDSPLLRELHSQFESQSQRVVEEAREVAEQLIEQRTSELHDKLNDEHRATAEAFYEKWRQEFDGRETNAKEQLSSELTQKLTAQVRQEVQENLNASWGDAIERAQAALSGWERRSEVLRAEARSVSEEVASQAERRLEEKLSQQLDEIRKELGSRAEHQIAFEQGNAGEALGIRDSVQEHLQEEMALAQTQWNELLESSIDSAAQRLAGRVTDSSQHILQAAEQKLAARVAELQGDSGLSIEAARAALDEVRSAFDQEMVRAKASLEEIEKATTHFSEYSRQLEAASHDGLNELRQRLESSVALHTAELDRRATELQKQLVERGQSQLEEMSGRTTAQTAVEISARIAPVLERAAEATRQLSAREQQAEDLLHIHRERLRQVSEQLQREAAGDLSSVRASFQGDLELARKDASAKWVAELDSHAARAVEEASAALAKSCEDQVRRGVSSLEARIEESVNDAKKNIDEASAGAAGKYRADLEKIEAAQLKTAGEQLDALGRKRLDLAKMQLEETAEGVAATFGQVIQAAAEDTVEHVAAESNTRAAQERARLAAGAEEILQSLQARAQTSFDHFQQQLAITAERNLAQSNEGLASQLAATLDVFREQGKAHLAEWSAKHEALGAEAFERHEDRLRSAGDSWVDATVHQLDALNQNRMDSLIRGAEEAMRRACVDVFDGLAQAMKEKLLDAFGESRHAAPPPASEENSRERRASA